MLKALGLDQELKAAFRPGMGQHIPDRLFWAREDGEASEDSENHEGDDWTCDRRELFEEAARVMGRQAGTVRGLTFRAIEALPPQTRPGVRAATAEKVAQALAAGLQLAAGFFPGAIGLPASPVAAPVDAAKIHFGITVTGATAQ